MDSSSNSELTITAGGTEAVAADAAGEIERERDGSSDKGLDGVGKRAAAAAEAVSDPNGAPPKKARWQAN